MTRSKTLITFIALLATATGFAGELASHADLKRILRTERFKLIRRVRQISADDWTAAGVRPQGRSITASMVEPGQSYQDQDGGVGDERQLFLAAANPRHEILSFWQATHGGPVLRMLVLARDGPKPRLIFYAMMNNDIPHEKWTWTELKEHILQDRMDVLISAEHPRPYDNRLP